MATKSTGKQLNILIDLQQSVFTMGSLVSFTFNNKINTIPTGEFILTDTNNDALTKLSGNVGSITFLNTNARTENKSSTLDFFVDDMIEVNSVNTNSTYKINWSAGNATELNSDTWAVKGTSVDAMLEIGDHYSISTTEGMSDANYEKPSDTMIWRYISDNVWDAFTRTINNSFLLNDYMFWAFDDVNNTIKISSFNFEKSKDDSSIFLYSENAKTNIDNVRIALDDPNITLWSYGNSIKGHLLGSKREELFPNAIFSGVNSGEMLITNCSGTEFNNLLSGDDSKTNIIDNTALTDITATYDKLKVIRNYPNNTHKMYSLAPLIRNYISGTYSKVLYVRLYNTIGPEIGTKVSVLSYNSKRKIDGLIIDKQYTDTYLIVEKKITVNNYKQTNMGKLTLTNSVEVSTLLTLVSKNLNDEGFDDTEKVFESIGEG